MAGTLNPITPARYSFAPLTSGPVHSGCLSRISGGILTFPETVVADLTQFSIADLDPAIAGITAQKHHVSACHGESLEMIAHFAGPIFVVAATDKQSVALNTKQILAGMQI